MTVTEMLTQGFRFAMGECPFSSYAFSSRACDSVRRGADSDVRADDAEPSAAADGSHVSFWYFIVT
jgi:hypothetical protein